MTWVRIPRETYIFMLNFSLPPRSKQLSVAYENEIKHDHSSLVKIILDPRYDLSYKALYIYSRSIAFIGVSSWRKLHAFQSRTMHKECRLMFTWKTLSTCKSMISSTKQYFIVENMSIYWHSFPPPLVLPEQYNCVSQFRNKHKSRETITFYSDFIWIIETMPSVLIYFINNKGITVLRK